jgi:hypothetical protein
MIKSDEIPNQHPNKIKHGQLSKKKLGDVET